MGNYAIVVIGASAGGIQALTQLVRQLPADLPAALFIVQHLYAEMLSTLPELLANASPWPAFHPRDGQTIQLGQIYVAPPNYHLLLRMPGLISLSQGPRENLHRPAIDPLFRTAARTYGARVVGVLLTGSKEDGAAGLWAVKMRGGLALVQDPADAQFPEMPQSALDFVPNVDYVAPLAELPGLLTAAVQQVVTAQTPVDVPVATIEAGSNSNMSPLMDDPDDPPQEPRTLTCPECGGALNPVATGNLIQYRCSVGHAFGLDSLQAAYHEVIEQTLWAAMRALLEQIALTRQLAKRTQIERLRKEYEQEIDAMQDHVRHLQEMLRGLKPDTVTGWTA